MRVLQLGPWPPPNGGVQTNLVAIRSLLLRKGHGCEVINLHRHRTGRDSGVHHPTTAAGILRLLSTLRFDIVHLHIGGGLPARLLSLAAVCTSLPRARSVLTFHSGGYAKSPDGRTAGPRTVRGLVFGRFDRIIAVNAEIARLFARFGVPDARIRLIPPHPLPAAPPEAALPGPIRAFFDAHSPVLVTVGLLEPEYDLGLQIEALGRIRARYPNAGLVIAGAGSLEESLKANIASRTYAEHILLCGDVPHPVALRLIHEAAVFLRTTLHDGDSVAVREALHLGTPVVATENGMRPEGVRLIAAGDAAGLCARVGQCLAAPRPPSRKEDPEANIGAVIALYEELLG
ncbi:MAG: glycosyltransferase family 4 protein [bacterium]|jgi:glycogen(starch) synthase